MKPTSAISKTIVLLSTAAVSLALTTTAQAQGLGFSFNPTPLPGARPTDSSVLVLDEETQTPLEGASVSFSDSLQGGDLRQAPTSTSGTVLFAGAAEHPRALTASKPGYTTISVVGVKTPRITLYMKRLPTTENQAQAIASGLMTGWPKSSTSDVIQLGIVFKSLSAFDLLSFEVDSFISPLKDTINILGPRQIPSNLSVPEQDVSFIFGSFTLNKPVYRLPIGVNHPVRLAGVQGTIASREILTLAQHGGKLSLDLLNKLKFNRLGATDPVMPLGEFRKDVPADQPLTPQHRITVSAPPFKADVIVASACDMDGDRQTLLPGDIKLAIDSDKPSSTIKPVSVNNVDKASRLSAKSRMVVTFAIGEKARQISGIVSDQAGADLSPGAYLNTADLGFLTQLPETVALDPLAGGMQNGLSAAIFEDAKSKPLWLVYSLPSAGKIEVPTRAFGGDLSRIHGYGVVHLEFAAGFDESSIDGISTMKTLTRFARSSSFPKKTESSQQGDSNL